MSSPRSGGVALVLRHDAERHDEGTTARVEAAWKAMDRANSQGLVHHKRAETCLVA